jgi:predicted dehydrogenase
VERWYTEAEDLLAECAPAGVSVVTPGAFHVAPSLAALARDTAVLLEKPVAMSGAEAAELLAGADASSAFVMPAHVLRFTPPYPEMRARVLAGSVGRVLGISARRERGADHERLFPGVHPALMTMVHDIDLALWISGASARRVTAYSRRAPSEDATAETVPQLLWATVEATDGSLWSLRVSWVLPVGDELGDRLEVFGPDGVEGVESHGAPDRLQAGIEAEVAHFCDCLRERRPSGVVSLADAVHGIAIAEAVIASSQAGGRVVEVSP